MKTATVLLPFIVALAAAQTPPAGTYQVSGIVVDHLTNRPLNHVLVQLISTAKNGGDASALTEADGHFLFSQVPKGKYQLLAEKRGQMPQGFHADGPFSTAIVVDGTQQTDNIVFPMNTDAAINATVIGDDGDPVRGAQVTLFHEGVVDGELHTTQAKSGITNSAGQVHFGHLGPGKYYLAVHAVPWFAQASQNEIVYPITFYGDTTDGAAAQSIVLPEGGSADAQITLRAVPAIHVKLAADRQTGVNLFVPGPAGTRIPASAASFRTPSLGIVFTPRDSVITRANGSSFRGVPPPPPPPPPLGTVEGGNGQMELGNIPAGRYEVVFRGDASGPGGAGRMVDLANGSTLSVEPPANSTITGRVIFDTPRPAGDIELLFIAQRGLISEVAADGTFKVDQASAGTIGVRLNTPGVMITSLTAKGARITHDNLEVSPGAAVDLTIHVTASESLATVEGLALRDNVAVPGAMILLLPQDLGRTRLIRRDQSDGDGSFTLSSVQPGRYTLLAIDDGKDLAYKNEEAIEPYLEGGSQLTIPLKANEPLKVSVQPRKR